MARTDTKGRVSYKSIRKPVGSFGTSIASALKKQDSAEDAIVDNQYESGQISADAYAANLQQRLARGYITPLQQVNLQEKLGNVQVKLQDAKVEAEYSAGGIKTQDYLSYQKQKLAQIPQTDSVAYQQQAQKVQQLTDKLEREQRTSFRVRRNLEISNMPEDSSERLQAKAEQFQQLADQARVDGDNQTADTLQTQANSYVQSAKRAQINDMITETKFDLSGMATEGLGVPNSEEGAKLYAQLTGQKVPQISGGGGVSGGGGGAIGGSTGGGYASSAVKNAYESLDRQQKSYQRTAQSMQQNQQLLARYDQAIAQATGDQKTQLTIARNNIADRIATGQNQLDIIESSIQETAGRVQELQAGAARTATTKNLAAQEKQLKLTEQKIETALRRGKDEKGNPYTKDDYLKDAVVLTGNRLQLKEVAATAYENFGDTDKAEQLRQDATTIQDSSFGNLYNQIINSGNEKNASNIFKQTAGRYELIRVGKAGGLDNVSGKALKPGDLTLKDVSQAKYDGTFGLDYVKDGNIFSEVNYPTAIDPLTGQQVTLRDINKIVSTNGKAPYFINAKGQPEALKFVQQKDNQGNTTYTPMTAQEFKKVAGKYEGVGITDAKGLAAKSPILFTAKQITVPGTNFKLPDVNVSKVLNESGKVADKFVKTAQAIQNPIGTIANEAVKGAPGFINNAIKGVQNLISPTTKAVQGAVGGVGKTIAGGLNAIGNFFTPKQAYAEGKEGQTQQKVATQSSNLTPGEGFTANTPEQYKSLIARSAKEAGVPSSVLSALLEQESSWDQNVINGTRKSSAGAQGIAQFMPATAAGLGINPLDPNQAIPAAAKYLAQQIKTFGSVDKGLAAYNAGAGNVRKYGGIPPFKETQNYVNKILNNAKTVIPTAPPISKPQVSKTVSKPVQPTVTPTPGLRSNQAIPSITPVKPQTVNINQPGLTVSRPAASKPAGQQQMPYVQPVQNLLRPVGNAIVGGMKAVDKALAPKPNYPLIKLPQINIPKPVTNVVSNIGKVVSNAISSVKKFFKF